MLQIKKIIFIFVILIGVLCGCSPNKNRSFDREEVFASMVNLEKDINQSLELVIFEEYGEIDPDTFSMVGLKINSKDPIQFNCDYSMRLFYFSEERNEWIEVQEGTICSPSESITLKHEENFVIEAPITFFPELPSDINASELRIYIEGKIMQNGQPTDETVSAFIDMPLSKKESNQ